MTSYPNYQLRNRSTGQTRSSNHLKRKESSKGSSMVNTFNNAQSEIHHDHRTNITFHQKPSYHPKIPPPLTNLKLIDSPVTPTRRQHSTDDSVDSDNEYREVRNRRKKNKGNQKQLVSQLPCQNGNYSDDHGTSVHLTTAIPPDPSLAIQQQPRITPESTHYALSRFPFAPYVLHFSSGNVTPKQVKEELIKFFEMNHQLVIEIANCRRSNTRNNTNDYDVLLFLKDSISFSHLLEQTRWPPSIAGEKFTFLSFPAIPPQLSLIIKNVDLHIDFDEFVEDLKSTYPEIKNVIRMKNKFQNFIKMIKVELTSPSIRHQLLEQKKLTVNHITYDIDEYLAPANVLICSKCMGIGHFKKQCLQINETCKTCGEQFSDYKLHNCSLIEKCIHCQQNHKSNALKCPIIKNFRAELTRNLLNSKKPVASSSTSSSAGNNNVVNNNFRWGQVDSCFPSLTPAQAFSNNPMMNKLDDLISKIVEVKEQLTNLTSKQTKFEEFMVEKSQSDERVIQKIESLCLNNNELKKDVAQLEVLFSRHDNMFTKLIFPILDDLLFFNAAQNLDKKGNPLDADLRSRFDRYRIQVKKASEVIHRTS
jgi:hypothetical protein